MKGREEYERIGRLAERLSPRVVIACGRWESAPLTVDQAGVVLEAVEHIGAHKDRHVVVDVRPAS